MSYPKIERNIYTVFEGICCALECCSDQGFINEIFEAFATARNLPWYSRTVVTIFGPEFSVNALSVIEEAAVLYTIAALRPRGSHAILFEL